MESPVGFALDHGDKRVEWTVHAYQARTASRVSKLSVCAASQQKGGESGE